MKPYRITAVACILFPLEFPTDSFRELRLQWKGTEQPTSLSVVGSDVSRTIHVLDLRGTKCRNAVHIDGLRLSNLTSLTVNQAVTVDSVREVLRSCQSLYCVRWLYVDQEVLPASGTWTMESFSLPELGELCVSGSISVPLIETCDMPELATLSVTKPIRPMRDIISHLIRWKTISILELCSVPSVSDGDFISIFQNLQELTYFSCDTWTPSTLRSLRILNEYSDDCTGDTAQLHCPLLADLIIDGVRSSPRWDQTPELLAVTLARYLKPLLRRRDVEYDEPLTVYLPSMKECDGLRGIGAIKFGKEYPIAWD
jgi:hypothetical protein